MGEQMKNAVVHRHVDESKKNPDQDSHILFSPQQQSRKNQQKSNIKPNIARRKLAAGNYL